MKNNVLDIKSSLFACYLAVVGLHLGGTASAQNTTSYSANAVPVSGTNNVAIGVGVLQVTSINSNSNAGVGYNALRYNTNGNGNSAFGNRALENNTASLNTAVGSAALILNTTGASNTALGASALKNNLDGFWNTGLGYSALNFNNGYGNSAVGNEALYNNTTGNFSAAVGNAALYHNTFGVANSAFGHRGLYNNISGSNNSSLGYYANVSLSNQSNATAIGFNCIVNASNKIRLGSSTVTVVEGPVSYTVSDGRFKTGVSEDDVIGLAFIQKLRPVVYHFDTRAFTEHLTQAMPDSVRKHYLAEDFAPSTAIRQSGFIAQEVEAAAKAVGYDFNGVSAPTHDGDNYSLAYSQFVVPLVKAVQEQQAQIEQQQAQIAALSALVHKLAGSAPSDKAPVITAESATSTIHVFPNPSTGRFTLRIPAEWTGVLHVTDLRGRSVLRQTLLPGNPEYQLDLTAQAKGSYLLQLDGSDGSRHTEKLVIE